MVDTDSGGTYYVRMLKRKITTSGNSAALVLSQDILALMGLSVGDEVDLQLIDRTLVVRPLPEIERERRISSAMDSVLSRRRSLLRRLAEGAGSK